MVGKCRDLCQDREVASKFLNNFNYEDIEIKKKNIGFYRNLKLLSKTSVTYYRAKKELTPIIFDTVEIYTEENTLNVVVFRLQLLLELIEKETGRHRFIKVELLDIAVSFDLFESDKNTDEEIIKCSIDLYKG